MAYKETAASLHFVKTNPSGNTTILVLDTVPQRERSTIATRLMDKNSLSAEQVAFLDDHPPRFCDIGIAMMGGEFCGNAVRSAAAWLVFDRCRWQPALQEAYTARFEVSCSGIDQNVPCVVRQKGRSLFDVSAEFPLPRSITEVEAGGQPLCMVEMPGITHFCLPMERALSMGEKEKLIQAVLSAYPAKAGDAEGILFWDGTFLDPFVYVKGTDTLVHESSCGSGTAAMAACLAFRGGKTVHIDARQAGGVIYGEAEYSSGVSALRIGGMVEITAEGIAYL